MKDYKIIYKLESPKEYLFKNKNISETITEITINEPNKLIASLFQPIAKLYYEYVLDMMQKQFITNGYKLEDKKETVDEMQERLNKEAKDKNNVGESDDESDDKINRKDDIKGKIAFVMSLDKEKYEICDKIFLDILLKSAYCNNNTSLVLEKDLIDQIFFKDYRNLLGEFLVNFLE